jgi:hypothetical protein
MPDGSPEARPATPSPAAEADATVRRSASQIEAAIQQRQERLARTLDELGVRLRPRNLARRAADDTRQELRSLVVDPVTGQPRVERIAAVLGALVVVVIVSVVARVRARRRAE